MSPWSGASLAGCHGNGRGPCDLYCTHPFVQGGVLCQDELKIFHLLLRSIATRALYSLHIQEFFLAHKTSKIEHNFVRLASAASAIFCVGCREKRSIPQSEVWKKMYTKLGRCSCAAGWSSWNLSGNRSSICNILFIAGQIDAQSINAGTRAWSFQCTKAPFAGHLKDKHATKTASSMMQKNIAEQGTNKDSKHDTTPVRPLPIKKPDKTGAWATAWQMSVHQDSL